MRNRIKSSVISLVVICMTASLPLVLSGCNIKRKGQIGVKQEINKPQARYDNIPPSLQRIELNAQLMIDDINNKDWSKAKERAINIEKQGLVYEPIAKMKNASETEKNTFLKDIKNLESNIKAKKQYEALILANKLTKQAIIFKGRYTNKVPTEVWMLGYYGRQILITSEHAAWKEAALASSNAEKVWYKIKVEAEKISTANAKTLSDIITAKLKRAIKKQDKSAVSSYAQKIKDEAKVLEAAFNKY